MKSILSYLFCLAFFPGEAMDKKFPVAAIPDSLKKDVNVVVRESNRTFRILTRSTATELTHYVYTVLNDRGKYYAQEVIPYDNLRKIKSMEANVYDADGRLIRRLKGSDIIDQSAVDNGTLYDDSRIKAFNLSQTVYPYTVEVDFQIDYKFLFYISGVDLHFEKVSSQGSVYSLQFPASHKELAPRYKLINVSQQPAKNTKDGFDIWTWTFGVRTPGMVEPATSASNRTESRIEFAPSVFEYDGYVGDMSTWDGFGRWIGTLNKGRNVLSDETKQKMVALTSKLPATEEKVKAVYEYMQGKTRYVGIQLGIGGFQPFEAAVVDKVGYGDCKALSNYMVSLLDAIGVKGYYTLIRAGSDGSFTDDFPSTQFNHATVFVPNKNDTIWLECTSQTAPFGYAGSFTGGRKALAITEDGAKIVWTPKYIEAQNVQSRFAGVAVDAHGNAIADVKTTYSGLQYGNDGLEFAVDRSSDDQKKWIQKNTDIPSFDLKSFSITSHKSRIPSAVVKMELVLNRFAAVSGKRLFLAANLMNRSTYLPDKLNSRRTNVIVNMGTIDFDTIRYRLPEDLYPEFLPEPVKISSRFGEYEASFKLDQGQVLYIRRLAIHKGVFPPDSYDEMIKFYKGISKSDNIKLVFLSKT